MYDEYTFPLDETIRELRDHQCAIVRFEGWLRSRGYEPERDPFMVVSGEGVDAVELVDEYLEDRHQERGNRQLLLRHAHEVGSVAPVWGDSGCGLAIAG